MKHPGVPPADSIAAARRAGQTKTVLIADDDWDLADALAVRAKRLGLAVQTAHGALATLRLLQTDPPDLVILDVRMPDGDGLSVCEAMAQDPDLARIPVLILTGLNDPLTVRRCSLSGARYVFKGPDLWRRLERHLVRLAHPAAAPLPREADTGAEIHSA